MLGHGHRNQFVLLHSAGVCQLRSPFTVILNFLTFSCSCGATLVVLASLISTLSSFCCSSYMFKKKTASSQSGLTSRSVLQPKLVPVCWQRQEEWWNLGTLRSRRRERSQLCATAATSTAEPETGKRRGLFEAAFKLATVQTCHATFVRMNGGDGSFPYP